MKILLCLLALTLTTASALEIQAEVGANPWTNLTLNNNPENFQFAIVSARTGGQRRGGFEAALGKLNLLQPEFVISLGNLIEGEGAAQEALDKQWDEFQQLVSPLQMPFFYLPGDSDLGSEKLAQAWAKRFGRTYYHFLHRDVLFLLLNTEDGAPTTISDAQVDYFEGVLKAQVQARWVLVFMHRPLWLEKECPGWAKIEAQLANRPHSVFAGHGDRYTRYERNGRGYYSLAPTGGSDRIHSAILGEFDGLAWVTMLPEGPRVANLDITGIHPDNVVDERTAPYVDNILAGALTISPIEAPGREFRKSKSQVRIRNTAELPLKASIRFDRHDVFEIIPGEISRTVAPKSEDTVEFAVKGLRPAQADKVAPLDLRYSLEYFPEGRPAIKRSGRRSVAIEGNFQCPPRTRPVAIDSQLHDWPVMQIACKSPVELEGDYDEWRGPEDCSYRFSVSYDATYLYLAIQTSDDQFVHPPANDFLRGDNLEIHLDGRSDEDQAKGEAKFQPLVVAFAAEGERQALWIRQPDSLPLGTKIEARRVPTGFNAEVAIPIGHLNALQGGDWKSFRLNICVNDFDGDSSSTTRVWWRPRWNGPENYQGSGVFHRIRLERADSLKTKSTSLE